MFRRFLCNHITIPKYIFREANERFFNPKEKYELHCDEKGKYYVSDKAGLYYYFEANSLGNAEIKQLSKIVNRDGPLLYLLIQKMVIF